MSEVVAERPGLKLTSFCGPGGKQMFQLDTPNHYIQLTVEEMVWLDEAWSKAFVDILMKPEGGG